MSDLVAVTVAQVLAKLDQVRRSLAECHDIAELRKLRDQAEAIRHYVKSAAMSLEMQNQAAVVKILCEFHAGKMLKKILKHGGDRRSDKHNAKSQLAELGIRNNMQSSRLQKVASVSEEKLMEYMRQAIDERKEVTTQGVLRYAQSLTQKNNASVADKSPFRAVNDGLRNLAARGKRFSCIYIDPPWCGQRRPKLIAMRKQLAELPIHTVAAANAHLHLWVSPELLEDGLALLNAWGFPYVSMLVRRLLPPEFGMYWKRAHRILLLGVRGQLPFQDTGLPSWFDDSDFLGSSGTMEIHRLLAAASPPPCLDVFAEKAVRDWFSPVAIGCNGKA